MPQDLSPVTRVPAPDCPRTPSSSATRRAADVAALLREHRATLRTLRTLRDRGAGAARFRATVCIASVQQRLRSAL